MRIDKARNMYKNIANTFILLFKSRSEAMISVREEDPRTFVESYFYPLLGVYSVSLFIGRLIHLESFDVAELLRYTLARVSSLVLSYYLISLSFRYLLEKYFKKSFSVQQMQVYVSYILSVNIVVGILLEFSFPEFLEAITLYIILLFWEGSRSFLQLEEEKRIENTLMSIFVFIGIKGLVSFFFNKLIL